MEEAWAYYISLQNVEHSLWARQGARPLNTDYLVQASQGSGNRYYHSFRLLVRKLLSEGQIRGQRSFHSLQSGCELRLV